MKRFKWLALMILVVFALAAAVGCGGSGDTGGAADPGENGAQTEEPPAQVEQPKDEYVIKFAHVVRPTTAKGEAAERFAQLIEERSDGRIKVEVYPDSQLGDDRQITEQMQLGTIQMNAPFTGVLPAFVPQTQLFDLPFLFPDSEAAFTALHGEAGDMIGEYLIDKNLKVLGYWDGGFKQMTNSRRPIETPEDMKGLKVRVSQSPLLEAQFKAMGANPVSITFNELYTALQQGTADGQENPLSNIATRRFYEVQDYMTMSDHNYMGYILMISNDFFQGLPQDLQSLIEEVAQEVTEWQWEASRASEAKFFEEISASGIAINELTPEQKEAFIEVTEEVYAEFEKIEGGKELVDAIRRTIN